MSRCFIWLSIVLLAGSQAACHRGSKSKDKQNRVERDANIFKEREQLRVFAKELDKLLQWRASPESPAEPAAAAAAISARLKAMSADGLPTNLKAAFQECQSAWAGLAEALAGNPAQDSKTKDMVRRADDADARLNKIMAELGYPDVAL